MKRLIGVFVIIVLGALFFPSTLSAQACGPGEFCPCGNPGAVCGVGCPVGEQCITDTSIPGGINACFPCQTNQTPTNPRQSPTPSPTIPPVLSCTRLGGSCSSDTNCCSGSCEFNRCINPATETPKTCYSAIGSSCDPGYAQCSQITQATYCCPTADAPEMCRIAENQFNNNNGDGESRLWFPHLRLIAALSTIAQAMMNPHPSSLSNNAPPSDKSASLENVGLVTTRIEEWQGIHDETPVVNTTTNNSSMIIGEKVPNTSTIISRAASPYNEAQCYVAETINNPGDDLLGPEITGRLTYTNKFEYDAAVPIPGSNPGQVKLEARGQINPFLKVPLIEYIYDVMIHGETSMFRRFMPQEKATNIKEIPAAVPYSVSAKNAGSGTLKNVEISGASSPTLYVPHVGSLKEYWLDDLQKALRPSGTTVKGVEGSTDGSTALACEAPEPFSSDLDAIITKAINIANEKEREAGNQDLYAINNMDKRILEAIYSIEGFVSYSLDLKSCEKNSASALGLMQITDGIMDDIVSADMLPTEEENICYPISGKFNRCNPYDEMELAARVLLLKVGKWDRTTKRPTGRINSKQDVYTAAYGYYGCYDPDQATIDRGDNIISSKEPRMGKVADNRDGKTNYSEVVCWRSGFCTSSSDYPWPRPPDSCGTNTP